MTSEHRPYSPQLQLEDLARSQTRVHLVDFGWSVTDISRDLGQDFVVYIVDNGRPSGLMFQVQHKGTKNADSYLLKCGDISYRLKVNHLKRWSGSLPPVFIMLWDVTRHGGWWIHADDAILALDGSKPNWRHQNTVMVRIPLSNETNRKGLRRLRAKVAAFALPSVSKAIGKEPTATIFLKRPATARGQAVLADFEGKLAVGDAFQLDGQFVHKIEFPDWLARLWGDVFADMSEGLIAREPQPSTKRFPIRLDVISPSGQTATVEYLDLRVVKQGSEQVTLSNAHQAVPVKFEFVAHRDGPFYLHSVSATLVGVDVCEIRDMLALRTSLSEGGRLRLENLDTGKSWETHIPAGLVEPPSYEAVRTANELCVIQNKTQCVLRWTPESRLTDEDIVAIHTIAEAVQTGRTMHDGANVRLKLTRRVLESLLEAYGRSEPSTTRLTYDETFAEVLGVEIPLGPSTRQVTGILDSPVEVLERAAAGLQPDESLEVTLTNATVVEEFNKWLP